MIAPLVRRKRVGEDQLMIAVPHRVRVAGMAFLLVLCAGVFLRLSFGQDIEYKFDEEWMFNQSQELAAHGDWPDLGMPSGVGLRNPGMSVWIFIALTKLFHVSTPVELARAVQMLNAAALLLVGWFAWRKASGADREAWFWGAALAAVNPIAVVLQRKIWAQSTLPFFSMLFLIGVWRHERAWGAFALGFVGILLGQVHMSGFFYFAVFMGCLLVSRRHEWKWGWTLLGIAVGFPPLFPWLRAVLGGGENHAPWAFHNFRDVQFFKLWITSTLAYDLKYSLGPHRWDFLSFPLIGSTKTWLGLVCWVVSIGAGSGILLRSLFWRVKRFAAHKRNSHNSKTGFLLRAGFWSFGLLMTVAPFQFHQHYLLIAFPLPFVWLARNGLRPISISRPGLGRTMLLICVVSQLVLSVLFLHYIHVRGGAPQGDYGVALSAASSKR